ncbi:MAG: hypothetical protein KGO53_03960 [Alphaproteobacteria bacterium]|nr:hypothetical protein [Alphaproteobacteria bacterium]
MAGPAAAEQYVGFVSRMVAQGTAQHLFRADVETRLLALLNAYRQAKGLKALAADPALAAAARAHAADMALHGFLGHVASTGHDFDSRMHALRGGALVLPSMGENAAEVPRPSEDPAVLAQSLFQTWLASAPHLHTMVSRDYLKVATGVAIVNGKAYADQIFIGPEVQTNMLRAP